MLAKAVMTIIIIVIIMIIVRCKGTLALQKRFAFFFFLLFLRLQRILCPFFVFFLFCAYLKSIIVESASVSDESQDVNAGDLDAFEPNLNNKTSFEENDKISLENEAIEPQSEEKV